jgi:hypothetical protein
MLRSSSFLFASIKRTADFNTITIWDCYSAAGAGRCIASNPEGGSFGNGTTRYTVEQQPLSAIPVPQKIHRLVHTDHSRDSVGMTYVYPVISRRAGGVSVGVNLNPNNACNWQCVYCQVPNLVRGGPPPIDLGRLERELNAFLNDAIHGDFFQSRVDPSMHRLVDIAFSGNGEPTSATEFPDAVKIAVAALDRFGLRGKTLLRLITNGSLVDRARVREGIAHLGQAPGEVWFKMDAATAKEIALVNGTRSTPERAARRLTQCADLAPTWVQTCVFLSDGKFSAREGWPDYLRILGDARSRLLGVHLYSLARQSMQEGADRLGQLDLEFMHRLANQIRQLGLTVTVNP